MPLEKAKLQLSTISLKISYSYPWNTGLTKSEHGIFSSVQMQRLEALHKLQKNL